MDRTSLIKKQSDRSAWRHQISVTHIVSHRSVGGQPLEDRGPRSRFYPFPLPFLRFFLGLHARAGLVNLVLFRLRSLLRLVLLVLADQAPGGCNSGGGREAGVICFLPHAPDSAV